MRLEGNRTADSRQAHFAQVIDTQTFPQECAWRPAASGRASRDSRGGATRTIWRVFIVPWTATATRVLKSRVRYIAREAQINAGTVLGRLQSRAESLARVPERGRLVPELLRHGLAIWRELIVKPYRILYRIEGQTVYVLAVLDARRNLEDVLLEHLFRT